MVRYMLAAVAATLATTLIACAEAHTVMTDPAPTFPSGFKATKNWIGAIDGRKFVDGKYDRSQGIAYGVNAVKNMTLREFASKNMKLYPVDDNGKKFQPTAECGVSLSSGTKQRLGDVIRMRFNHPGPCELWCDNTRLLYNANCWASNLNEFKIDKTKCAGASFVQGTMLAVHLSSWQVFRNCVPLVGGTETDPKKAMRANAPGSRSSVVPGGTSYKEIDVAYKNSNNPGLQWPPSKGSGAVPKKPADDKKKPANDKKKPTNDKKKPTNDKKKPANDKKKRADDKKKRADDKKKSRDKENPTERSRRPRRSRGSTPGTVKAYH